MGRLLGVASAFVILAFYGVVGGWIMRYIFIALSGGFDALNSSPDAAKNLFVSFTGINMVSDFFPNGIYVHMYFCYH